MDTKLPNETDYKFPTVSHQAVQPPLVSLADLPSTTPRPSPLLQTALQTVPGTNQGMEIIQFHASKATKKVL